MAARLVQLDGERIVSSHPLGSSPFRIGRDPGVELRIDRERVSRHHARIERAGPGHVLVDLGTPNGTTRNGAPVRGRTALEPGDVVTVAGEVTFRYERTRGARPYALAALAAAGLLAAGGLFWALREPPPDPAWALAAASAQRAVAAVHAGEPVVARTRFKTAVGELYKAGLLDDVERRRVMEAGLERIGARLDPPIDLVVLHRQVVRETEVAPISDQPPCRLDRAEPPTLPACLSAGIAWLFARMHQSSTEIPKEFVVQVGTTLRSEHDFLESALARGEPLAPMLSHELERARMPPLLRYVALIESGYRTDARSTAGAVGLWQFMPGTARDYHLHVDAGRDERTDALRSTRAASLYLKHLVFEFGSDALLLALAGYNFGQNRVRDALKQLDDPFADRSYWRLVERGLLPAETAAYVARFSAAALAGEAGLPAPDALAAAGY